MKLNFLAAGVTRFSARDFETVSKISLLETNVKDS
jgi:hypothetical protein